MMVITTALEGLRVLDFSQGLPGVLTAMLRCHNAAEVIKVEPTGGEPQRTVPAFLMWHHGKESVVLDLENSFDRMCARHLAEATGGVVQKWQPAVAKRLSHDHRALVTGNSGLISPHIRAAVAVRAPEALREHHDSHGEHYGRACAIGRSAGTMRCRRAGGERWALSTAVQGIPDGLSPRYRTGCKQKVEICLVQGLTAYDRYHRRGPQVPLAVDGHRVPAVIASVTPTADRKLVGETPDGKWLQFLPWTGRRQDAHGATTSVSSRPAPFRPT